MLWNILVNENVNRLIISKGTLSSCVKQGLADSNPTRWLKKRECVLCYQNWLDKALAARRMCVNREKNKIMDKAFDRGDESDE